MIPIEIYEGSVEINLGPHDENIPECELWWRPVLFIMTKQHGHACSIAAHSTNSVLTDMADFCALPFTLPPYQIMDQSQGIFT